MVRERCVERQLNEFAIRLGPSEVLTIQDYCQMGHTEIRIQY